MQFFYLFFFLAKFHILGQVQKHFAYKHVQLQAVTGLKLKR